MNILIFIPTVGKNKYVDKIVEYKHKSKDHLIYLATVDYNEFKGQKWQLAKAYLNPSFQDKYDYICIWDDDLELSNDFDFDRYFKIVSEAKLEVSQPALTSDSYYSHQVTVQQKQDFAGRITGFVEIMCPVFTREAWKKFYPILDDKNNSGWGYDFLFHKIGTCGIIDVCTLKHTRPVQSGSKFNAQQECTTFLEKNKLDRTYTGDIGWIYE